MRRKSGKPFGLLRDGLLVACLLTLGTLIAAKLDGLNQQHFSGRFIAIDGDTLVFERERFRLIGIDAPELAQTCGNGDDPWPCGARAKDYLKALLAAGTSECSGTELDRYGRMLVHCSVAGKDVGAAMVAAGYAVATEYFLFSSEQASAREGRLGIWSGPFTPPRNWRREHRAADMETPFAGILGIIRHALGW